jgi:RNA polymerase sigma-70 factor (ECF subfamily)
LLDGLEASVPAPSVGDDFSQDALLCIREAMERLPTAFREALTLHMGGLTHRKVGERLGLSLSGTKSSIQRGREKIRRILTGCWCYHIEADQYGNIVYLEIKERTGLFLAH